MRLRSVRVKGYKRFEVESEFRVSGPLHAIVGPNEAGKTSFLCALTHLTDRRAFDRREYTGRYVPEGGPVIVDATYEVEVEDVAALSDLLHPKTVYVFKVERRAEEANLRAGLTPTLNRDLGPRQRLVATLRMLIEAGSLQIEAEDEAPDTTHEDRASGLVEDLGGDDQTLSESRREELTTLADEWETAHSDADVLEAAEALRELSEIEAQPHPNVEARRRLIERLPRFLFFDDEQRDLETNYEWGDYEDPTPSLANVFALAELDFHDYRTIALDRDRRDELETIERRINQTLVEKFAVWTQEELSLALRGDAQGLELQIRDHKTLRNVRFDERSAGLRSFIALIAFASRYGGATAPILLVDEAETHLHYGGQADLIKVFERQQVAQAIIYTTHSIGCLPEDLGTTIRVVKPISTERSVVENSFWLGGGGLTPLMLSMGAHALAFTPARLAVLTEGPSDAILLPSLFRAARAPRFAGTPLGFQIAPGIANVAGSTAPELEYEAGGVVYLIDADEGGRLHGDKLSERARGEGRVVELGEDEGLCIEDLVEGGTLTRAFNEVLRATRTTTAELTPEELPLVSRPKSMDAWCETNGVEPLSKTFVAQRVVELASGGAPLLQKARKPQTRLLYTNLRRKFGLSTA